MTRELEESPDEAGGEAEYLGGRSLDIEIVGGVSLMLAELAHQRPGPI